MRIQALLLVALLAACGHAAPSPSAEGASCVPAADVAAIGAAADSGSAVAIDAGDDYFSPACIVVGPAGNSGSTTHVTIVVRNIGHHPHNIRVAGAAAVGVDAGQVAFLSVEVETEPLSYACTIHPHMIGELRRSGP